MKNAVISHLSERGFTVLDVGTDSTASCDYPIFADALCKKIQLGECELGILVCGTGIGMSIAANKHKGIRAACCSDTYSAKLTREHNDANVLVMPGRFIDNATAKEIMDQFFSTPFEGGRHLERIADIPLKK